MSILKKAGSNFLCLAALLLACPVQSQTWITGVKIKEISSYASGRNAVYRVKIEGSFPSVGCAVTDNSGVISHVDGSHNPSALWQTMYSTALVAYSQDDLVDLLVGACRASEGAAWEGIRIAP